MKQIARTITFLLILTFIAGANFGQSEGDDPNVAQPLKNLLELSKAKNYTAAAKLILYTGEDQSRNYKDSLNPKDSKELAQAKRICKKVSALLDISSSYELGKSIISKNADRDVYSIEVTFASGEQKLNTNFKFIKAAQKFLLIDID